MQHHTGGKQTTAPSANKGQTAPAGLPRRRLLTMGIASAAAIGTMNLLSACGSQAIPGAEADAVIAGKNGLLRAGIVGGSSKDSLDAHMPLTQPDQARVINLYDGLVGYNEKFEVEMRLAESLTPNESATEWLIKLRPGTTFHDGRPVTANDVVATLKRILNPENPKSAATSFAAVDFTKTIVKDDQTLLLGLKHPDVTVVDAFSQYSAGIVPADYDPAQPVGAGPFKFVSFQPGQQSIFVAHAGYWRENQPGISQLKIINFPDDTARVNALLGGQVDVIDQLPIALIPVVQKQDNLRVLTSETGSWLPFTMRVDTAPFDDVRVRQALRLVIDREAMVKQVLSGQGRVGNDVFAPIDPMYNDALPQRKQDIAAAKKLLKEAGHENLTLELVTAPVAAGTVEAATVFVSQAADAGITIKLKRVDASEFYGDQYLQWPFAQDFWFTRSFLPQANASMLKTSPYNETHFDDPAYAALIAQASGTADPEERKALIAQAQQIEYDRGGNIIWGFTNQVDGYSMRVRGLVPDNSGIPLSGYNFRKVTMEA